jgi:hypothetical protein
MPRTPIAVCGSVLLLAIVAAASAQADELPLRKAGLWKMKNANANQVGYQCTDETVDKELTGVTDLLEDGKCSKPEIRKTTSGYTVDVVCDIDGDKVSKHMEVAGDLTSDYTAEMVVGKGDGKVAMTVDAKWLGACKAGQKPGDMETPKGKFNIMDTIEKRASQREHTIAASRAYTAPTAPGSRP